MRQWDWEFSSDNKSVTTYAPNYSAPKINDVYDNTDLLLREVGWYIYIIEAC